MILKLIENPLYYQEGLHENHKGGSSPDTSGLEEATKQATALQERMYDQTREDVRPWYQMGTGGVSKLSDLLGISGGSVLSREQMAEQLSPQYTTTQNNGTGFYTDSQGNIKSSSYFDSLNPTAGGYGTGVKKDGDNYLLVNEGINQGYETWSPYQSSTTSTDTEALNAAIDSAMANQETPDNYGSLLKKFGMDDFEQDAGYQFRQDEANKALERSMSAQGVTLGGAGFGDINPSAYRAMEELNQGLASQEYGNAYNRYVQDNLNTFNMLMGASGSGQGTTGTLATAGQNYATNVGNLQTGLAGAQFNAQQQSGGGMFGSLLGMGAGALIGGPTGAQIGSQVGGSVFG